jgi:hypothetical protein
MVGALEPQQICLVMRTSTGLQLTPSPSVNATNFALGITVPRRCLIGCEDEVGRIIALAILRLTGSQLHWTGDVVVAGDASKVLRLVDSVPDRRDWLTVVGILDGDQRKDDEAAKRKGRVAFLPSTEGPESWMRGISHKNVKALADRLSVEADELMASLDGLRGLDAHDWLMSLSDALQRTPEDVVNSILATAFGTSEGSAEIREFAQSLEAIASGEADNASVSTPTVDEAKVVAAGDALGESWVRRPGRSSSRRDG